MYYNKKKIVQACLRYLCIAIFIHMDMYLLSNKKKIYSSTSALISKPMHVSLSILKLSQYNLKIFSTSSFGIFLIISFSFLLFLSFSVFQFYLFFFLCILPRTIGFPLYFCGFFFVLILQKLGVRRIIMKTMGNYKFSSIDFLEMPQKCSKNEFFKKKPKKYTNARVH